ncbi:MAG: hypothetical protein GXP54_11670, partial [Deltaproteobacteria bacterium]|nr:hypothetical protein [Deltaproteobacteria bacterium]
NDGCGVSCGDCPDGKACQAGQCIGSSGEVEVIGISPDFGYNDVETPVSIVGNGFKPGLTAKVGAVSLSSIQVAGDTVVEAVVPKGMEPGSYMVLIVNSDQTTGFLADAFQVRKREATAPDEGPSFPDIGPACGDGCSEGVTGGGGGSCTAGAKAPRETSIAFMILLAGLLFMVRQRRAG